MFPDKEYLLTVVRTRMPFGKYKGRLMMICLRRIFCSLSNRDFQKMN
ncbi:putative quorum-sensing-regulated virulence factor [Candidatus Brocadia sp. AMX2]